MLHIHKLDIEAFRGFPDHIHLDLQSPLTLIYAANGTGKTTVCDAAEWLLTGLVERLRDGQRFDDEVLVSKFAEGRQPKVSAQVMLVTEFRSLERTRLSSRIGSDPSSQYDLPLTDWLERLAPEGAASGVHHLTAISHRQNWLRGTRFLSWEALSTLIDTDEKTIERRKQVFADLLGIRHLVDAEDKLNRYSGWLAPEERALTRQSEELEAALLTAQLARGELPAQSSPATDTIRQAEELLNLRAPNLAIERRLEEAAAALGFRQQKLAQLHEGLSHLTGAASESQDLIGKIERDSALERSTAHDLDTAEASLRRADDALRAVAAQQQDTSLLQQALAELRDVGAQLLRRVLAIWERRLAGPELQQTQTLREIRRLLPEVSWSVAARRARWERIRISAVQGAEIAAQRQQMQALARELDALSPGLSTPDGLRVLEANILRAEQAVASERARLDTAIQIVERLQAAARHFLTHSADVSECPVCGHDWASAQALRSAVESVAVNVDALLRTDDERFRVAVAELESIRRAKEGAVQTIARAQRLRQQLAEINEPISRFENAVRELGLDPRAPNLSAQFDYLDERAALIEAVADLDQSLSRWATSITDLDFLDDISLTAAPQELEGRTRNRALEVSNRAAADNHQAAELSAVRSRLSRQIAGSNALLEECRARLATNTQRLHNIRVVWHSIGGDSDPREEDVERARVRAATEAEQLRLAEQYLTASKLAVEYEVGRRRVEELESARSTTAKRRTRIRNRIVAAEGAVETIRTHYGERSRQQINELRVVVNALFARMQANRLFDEIRPGSGDDFLRWLGAAGSWTFDPRSEFSLGQRQDLALALFLARARTIGGTFFLDEPLAHLDDLNRVGLLDVLRATAIEGRGRLNLVVTTSSRALSRHLIEKFTRVPSLPTSMGPVPGLRVIELFGNARTGVSKIDVFPLQS